MQCPKCNQAMLKERSLRGKKMRLDHCSSCDGVWFDAGELCNLLGSKALKPFKIPSFAQPLKGSHCPKCQKSLFEFCYPGTITLVDACMDCSGIWLDHNEWKEIGSARDEKNLMTCPKCSSVQVKAVSCGSCSIVIAKYLDRVKQDQDQDKNQEQKQPQEPQDSVEQPESEMSYADDIPGVKGGMLRFIDRSITKLTDY
jgi:Zn-finger nucleic acid-binding protein